MSFLVTRTFPARTARVDEDLQRCGRMAVSELAFRQRTSGTRHGEFSLALRCVLVSLQAARLTKKAMRRTGPKSVVCVRIQQLGEPGGPSIKLTTDAGPYDDAPPRRRKNHKATYSPRSRTSNSAAGGKKAPTSYLQSSFANASSAASAVLKSASDAA